MQEHIRANHTLTREEHDNRTLRDMFAGNPFKIEIMNDKIGMDIGSSAYRQGDFADLCLGPPCSLNFVLEMVQADRH